MLPSILRNLLVRQVSVGDMYVPPSSLESVLGFRCVNLVRFTGDHDYEFNLCGSGFGLTYRSRVLLLATQHQMPDKEYGSYGLLVKDRARMVSSSRYRGYDKADHGFASEHLDLCVLDFTESVSQYPSMRKHFPIIHDGEFMSGAEEVICFVALGCAFSDQDYDVFEKRHFGSAIRSIICLPGEPTSDTSIISMKVENPVGIDPNGMSGGPVFSLCCRGLDYFVKFAGIISRANASTIHAIHARHSIVLLKARTDDKYT